MKIKDYVKPTAANIYAADVAELIAAGDNKSGAITVANDAPKRDENGNAKTDANGVEISDNSIDNAKRAFQAAARDAERTARLLSITDNGDGTSDLEFVLSALIVRKGKDETTDEDSAADEETATDAEYPAADETPETETEGKRSRR